MRYFEILESDYNVKAYHGTTSSFDKFDPSRTGDIGMHFGTSQQAHNATKDFFMKYKDGANMSLVNLGV